MDYGYIQMFYRGTFLSVDLLVCALCKTRFRSQKKKRLWQGIFSEKFYYFRKSFIVSNMRRDIFSNRITKIFVTSVIMERGLDEW